MPDSHILHPLDVMDIVDVSVFVNGCGWDDKDKTVNRLILG
jgi:hypothetical protein